jgi:hypothetical protein
MRVLGDAKFEDVLACCQRENAGSTTLPWTIRELEKADRNGSGRWKLVMLSREDILRVVLPHHCRCGVELVPESGLTVLAAAATARAVTGETGECWNNIAFQKSRDFSQTHIFLKTENGGLSHLDGLHRLLAWVIFEKQEELHAYVAQTS